MIGNGSWALVVSLGAVSSGPGEPIDRRARRRAETRTRLSDAAQTMVALQGVDATQINDITEAADVGFGSFYDYFDGKDAIVAAVMARPWRYRRQLAIRTAATNAR